ncbi:MAG: DUF2971 domain-containing protein [Oscillospiraceae bacterium]|nr:DUF2971 domain-containing protein [Oscillospiraceae bacterium]
MSKPDFLYHYTSLESLASILKNKTIRFNQLARLDDLQEGQSQDLEHYEEFIFASSWTEESKENIPMWKMYSSQFSGIRIKMPVNPFTVKPIDYQGKPWFVAQCSEGQSQAFLRKVEYIDDNDEQLNPTALLDRGSGYIHATPLLGWHKSTAWEFQKEWRYLLYFGPVNKAEMNSPDTFRKATKRFRQRGYLPFTHVDLPLRDDIFSQVEITYSPWFTEGNKILLQCLLNTYAPCIKVQASSLTGKIR